MSEYRPTELVRMSDEEVADLSDEEQQRREKLLALHSESEETKKDWADQRQRITDIVVNADREALGTRVDVFGNDLLVRVHSENTDLRESAERLESFADDEREMADLPAEDREDLAAYLIEMLDAVLLEWNGTDWTDLPEDERYGVLFRAREDWALDGLLSAWLNIAAAISEERDEQMEVVDRFQ